MAATGFTPISLYYSTTASAVPTAGNLANGELALNIADMKLYAKNSSGTVTLLASNASTTPVTPAGSNTQIQYNNSGSFGASSALTFNGTLLGISAAGARIQVTNSNGGNVASFTNSSSADLTIDLTAGVSLISPSTSVLAFGTASTERARFSGANFGIDTGSPTCKLSVNGVVQVTSSGNPSSGAGLEIGYGTVTAGRTALQSYNRTGSAYLGADYNALSHIFYISGTERSRVQTGFSVGTSADPGAGAIYATGAITAFYSDKRLKTVSGKIENALDKVGQLSGVYYTNNDTAKSFGYDSDEVQVGVIAQEVEAVLPQIVKAAPFDLDQDGNSKSGQNYKTVQYDKLTPLLIEAINELRAEVTALKGTI